jgi:hypothetical protein
METAETMMEKNGDGSGGTSLSWQDARTETSILEIRRRWQRSCGTLSRKLPIVLRFSVGRLLIGEGASSEVDQGGLTMGGRCQGLGRTPLLCGQPLAPLWLPFGPRPLSGKNRSSKTCFVQFQEYFLCRFSKTQKHQKIGN